MKIQQHTITTIPQKIENLLNNIFTKIVIGNTDIEIDIGMVEEEEEEVDIIETAMKIELKYMCRKNQL